jgi:hypothetical protein
MISPARQLQVALFTLLSLLSFASLADDTPWYEVEIIVFAQAKGSYHDSENWSQDLAAPNFANAKALAPAGSGRAFQALDASHFRLQREWNKLQNSSEYHPLLHMGWIQPGLANDKAVGVLVEAGAPSADLGGAQPLSGVITVELSRYLHLDANLLYRKAVTPSSEGAPKFETYQLSESRRMRSREIHYLDQPMFGVIALITPTK